jgi:hypothetical protein
VNDSLQRDRHASALDEQQQRHAAIKMFRSEEIHVRQGEVGVSAHVTPVNGADSESDKRSRNRQVC